MDSFKSSFYLPENLLTDDTPFYPHSSDVLDKSLELTFFSEINKLKNLYNPSSEYYDTDYILDLLGQDTLKNLLSDVTDRISLTMILSGIQNIKGTKKAFYAILKLLKIEYKTIVFRTLANGCTEVTIVFEQGKRINLNDIALLDRFSQEIFPLCLSLTGITNCTVYEVSNIYNGFNTVDLGVHYLDRSFTLDMSKLDTTYGIINTSVSNNISLLICNNTSSSFTVPDTQIDNLQGKNTSSYLIYARGTQLLLDRNLILDRFDPVVYYGFDVAHGRLTDHSFVYTNNNFATDDIRLSPKYLFRLDRSLMDVAVFEPLDGLNSVKTNIDSLDRGFVLGKTLLDKAKVTITQVTNPVLHKTHSDTNAVLSSYVFDNTVNSQKLKLNYSYPSASQYLPMLNI